MIDGDGMAIYRAMQIWVRILAGWLRLTYFAIAIWNGGFVMFVIEQ